MTRLRFPWPAATLPLLVVAGALSAQQMEVTSPGRSGIPGEEIRRVVWAPDGKVWVAARWPFWGDGGIGVYDRHSRTWEVWSSEEVLPSPFVNDIEFDAAGVAWIATNGGLVRWDGRTWTVWDASNSPMAFSEVRDLAVAPNGHVWVNNSSFNAGGDAIWDFDGVSTWVAHRVPEQLPWAAPWNDLSEVFVDRAGTVWVANDTLNGVARYDGRSWSLFGAGVTRFDDMAEDQLGNLWLLSNPVGGTYAYYRFDGQQFRTYPLSSPTTLRADPQDGTIYAASWNGVVQRTRNGGQTVETFLTGLNIVVDVAPDPASEDVWIGTLGALGHFDPGPNLVRDYNTYNTGMPDYFVDYFGNDRSGNFWLASGEAGLSRFDGHRWRNWGNHNAGSEPYPFAGNEPMGGVYEDRQGTHWFGGNGIARWQSATGQFTGFWNWRNNPGMGVTLFPFFAEDAAGHLFAASEYGATFRFDPALSRWVREPVQPYAVLGLPGMASDSRGDVWIAAWFDVHHWDGTAWSLVQLPDPNYFFDLGGINAFAIAPDDSLWFATSGGIVHWDRATFTLHDASTVPLPGTAVFGIDVRADGVLGIAARTSSQQSGVALVDGPITDPASWTTWLWGQSPLPHWQIERCAFDGRGDLWVSAVSEGAAVVRSGAWRDLGAALAGTHGEPRLLGLGPAVGGELFGLSLTGALAGTPGIHVFGTSNQSVPLFGGVMVPTLDGWLPFQANNLGDARLAAKWPVGVPPGLQLFVQSWMLDAGAIQGFAASGALVVTAR